MALKNIANPFDFERNFYFKTVFFKAHYHKAFLKARKFLVFPACCSSWILDFLVATNGYQFNPNSNAQGNQVLENHSPSAGKNCVSVKE